MTFYELPLEVQGKCKHLSPGEMYQLASVYVAQGRFEEGLAIAKEASAQLDALMIWKRAAGE